MSKVSIGELQQRFERMVECKTSLYDECFKPYKERFEAHIGDCGFNSVAKFILSNERDKSNSLGFLDDKQTTVFLAKELFKRLKYGDAHSAKVRKH